MKSNNNNNSSCSSANSQCSEGDEASGTRNKTTMLKKGPWSAAEDAILIEYVQKHGEGNWNSVQKNCGLARCGKSCRLRWANHLRPNLKKGSFTPEEEMLILHLHAQYGNKWARMAAQMPGRTDNEIKNYWNTRIKRRQRAGLPIYPTRGVGGAHPPPALIPPSTNTGNPYNSLILQESPRVKRVRDDGLTFQFPTSPTAALSPYMNNNNSMGVAPTTSAMSMFQFNNNRNYMNTTELNNDGIYNGGGESQCRIMEALLQENGSDHNVQRSKWDFENSLNGNVFSGNGDRKDLLVDSLPKLDESTYSNGMRILKRERAESDETTNVSSTNDDISKIFDMISVPTGAPQAPEWHNPINVAADSCGLSNGAQSSVITDDELGLELQHFASSITQADQDWANIVGSSPWNNLPGIG